MGYPPDDADEDLTRATHELGDPEALFQVSAARHRAKLFTAVGLLLFGVAANYGWWVHGPGRKGFVEAKLLIAPAVIGAGLLIHMWRNRGLSVLVYPTGVLRLRRGEVESFPWAEVAEVRVKGDAADAPQVRLGDDGRVTACWIPMAAPTFQVWGAWLQVKRADDAEAKFSSALADYPDLAERVQKGTFAVLWPAALADLSAGRPVAFGELSAEPGGLRKGKHFLPWAEVKELTVSQKHLSVKRKGKWLPWQTLDLAAVANPHVLYAAYAVMRDTPPAGAAEEEAEEVEDDGR
jgi:hypothetical protein